MDEMLLWVEVASEGEVQLPICEARDYATAMALRGAAVAHGRATGKTVQLVKFVRGQVLEEIEP